MSSARVSAAVPHDSERDGPLPLTRAVWVQAALVALSAGAAVIHAIVAVNHLGDAWPEATFFAVAALGQLVWAVAIIVSDARWVLITGFWGNVALVAVWLVSHTVGMPVGAHAGEVLSVGFADGVSQLLHLLLIAGAALLFARDRAPVRWPVPRTLVGASLVVLLAVVPLTAAAAGVAAFDDGHDQGHAHDGGQGHQQDDGEVTPAGHERGDRHEEGPADGHEQEPAPDSAEGQDQEPVEDSADTGGSDDGQADEAGPELDDRHAHEHEDDHDHAHDESG